jgi:hypothetical protein
VWKGSAADVPAPAVVASTVVLVVCLKSADAVDTLVAVIATVVGMKAERALLVKTPRIA